MITIRIEMLSTKSKEKTTMMIEEFIKLTGFTPDQDYYYLFIEKEYMNSKLEKKEWCEQWLKNGEIQKAYDTMKEKAELDQKAYESTVKEYLSLTDDYDKLLKERSEALEKNKILTNALSAVKEQLDCTQAMYKNLLEDLEMELYK